MSTRAVALLSGGLDSILAVRTLQQQGIEVEALNFRTLFTCCQDQASQAARRLGITLTALHAEDEYLQRVRRPQFGYGRGANPCVDCRIYMFQRASEYMRQVGASLVVSGEVLGQRPNSQKRRDLRVIEWHSGLQGRLLRPLSAKLLPPTLPEQEGQVDREQLHAFSGRSRKGLIALAQRFGFAADEIPSPSTGCALTEKTFAPRVFDLLKMDKKNTPWDFELLKVGRHLRLTSATKAVIGRRADENQLLEYLAGRPDSRAAAVLQPANFAGPTVLLVGTVDDLALETAGALLLRFAKDPPPGPQVLLRRDGRQSLRPVDHHPAAETAETL
ncbi:MAG: hypothetical protein GTO53_06105 [Planctomycetales bacterium]|nr:hypothetical protein [Planctomycetales bacterium]NIM08716.1 hypothetical protein [Planctomycetales bacterium]NIN08186.1 hypothetical protein [Planctomycetales bacterium]NIN77314.1 hypothetical protein [Planctomycetales bacterium]NIO34498.1 hypothetical protein [Planctomycetales bacterium]